jgi:hypothetical protein
MAAVQQDGFALAFAQEFQNNIEVVMAAVQQNGVALAFAPAFQNDRKVVMEAVQQNGMALQFSPTFRSDPEIACAAVRSNPLALNIIDPSLDENNDFIECMVKYKLRAIGRPVLDEHIMKRANFNIVAKRSMKEPMNDLIKPFLGGTRRKQKRKRTGKSNITICWYGSYY